VSAFTFFASLLVLFDGGGSESEMCAVLAAADVVGGEFATAD
jgi:hypothetical protein